MAKNKAQLEKEVIAAKQSIQKRYEYYRNAKHNMRNLIENYFFTERNKGLFQEVLNNSTYERGYTQFKELLLDSSLEDVQAYFENIINSDLGFSQEADRLVFFSKPNLKVETIGLMQQLASALSAFSVCWFIESMYNHLVKDRHLETKGYEHYKPEIEQLKNTFNKITSTDFKLHENIPDFYQQALRIQEDLSTSDKKIKEGQDDFLLMLDKFKGALPVGLKNSGKQLIKDRDSLSKESWTNNYWKPLVVNLVHQLFSGYYYYSYAFMGGMNINDKYAPILLRELDDFRKVVTDSLPFLKSELIFEAKNQLTELIKSIREVALKKNIRLDEHSERKKPQERSSKFSIYAAFTQKSQAQLFNTENRQENSFL